MPYRVRNLWSQYLVHEKLPKVFTDAECEKIIATYGEKLTDRAEVTVAGQQYRDTDLRWVRGEDATAAWIFERLEKTVLKWNANNFNFDIDTCSDLQFGLYKVGQMYHWHADLGSGTLSRRKISSVLMLTPRSEYKGGDLEIFVGEAGAKALPLERGDVAVFTSWTKHRVTPVTDGARYSLVGWWTGPPYR